MPRSSSGCQYLQSKLVERIGEVSAALILIDASILNSIAFSAVGACSAIFAPCNNDTQHDTTPARICDGGIARLRIQTPVIGPRLARIGAAEYSMAASNPSPTNGDIDIGGYGNPC